MSFQSGDALSGLIGEGLRPMAAADPPDRSNTAIPGLSDLPSASKARIAERSQLLRYTRKLNTSTPPLTDGKIEISAPGFNGVAKSPL